MESTCPIRVIIIENPREYSPSQWLTPKDSDIDITHTGLGLESGLCLITQEQPDIVLVDFQLYRKQLLAALNTRIMSYRSKFVAFNVEEEATGLVEYAEKGVWGFLPPLADAETIKSTIRSVADGEVVFSPRLVHQMFCKLAASGHTSASQEWIDSTELSVREVEVLTLVAQHLSNSEIAEELCVSVHTVKNHVHQILHKIGVKTRSQAACYLAALNDQGNRR